MAEDVQKFIFGPFQMSYTGMKCWECHYQFSFGLEPGYRPPCDCQWDNSRHKWWRLHPGARATVLAWMMAAKRRGVPRDVALIVSRQLGEGRVHACHLLDQPTKHSQRMRTYERVSKKDAFFKAIKRRELGVFFWALLVGPILVGVVALFHSL